MADSTTQINICVENHDLQYLLVVPDFAKLLFILLECSAKVTVIGQYCTSIGQKKK